MIYIWPPAWYSCSQLLQLEMTTLLAFCDSFRMAFCFGSREGSTVHSDLCRNLLSLEISLTQEGLRSENSANYKLGIFTVVIRDLWQSSPQILISDTIVGGGDIFDTMERSLYCTPGFGEVKWQFRNMCDIQMGFFFLKKFYIPVHLFCLTFGWWWCQFGKTSSWYVWMLHIRNDIMSICINVQMLCNHRFLFPLFMCGVLLKTFSTALKLMLYLGSGKGRMQKNLLLSLSLT